MATTNRLPALLLSLFLILQLLSLAVSAQDCSKTKLCSIGCCSKDGFCGTTSAHCGSGCLSTCDYKPAATECSAKKLCATGCCSKDGFCGTTSAHCGSGCQSTCDFKLGCDKSNPCKDGSCCSKFGFCGFGPDFCSKDTCVTGCDAKTYCDPGGYGSEYAEHTKCPLNVCCSKWGYCGLTEEFCGKKKVNRPSCSAKGLPMKRVVGYYEGWAPGRVCNKFEPSDIPDGVYTHLNFAFASIDPTTFQVVPAAKGDTELYRQLTQKKRADANLKVFLAIGGWAFNDPGPTATTFSDIARSEANQRAFISSLVSLMNTYNFDGVDIDWEYPEAPDRQGRGEDFANLPKFLRNIKSSLTQNGAKNGLSIAVPASYWYLQHFDIVNIAKHVDFFNVMTYDLHGSWDTPESWLGSHLNSHTNLTEIEDALDLLWRNQIDPDQVNLGLAFYSRTFTASNPGCMSPGCLFTSGAAKGPCSNAVGVLSNAEIDRKVSSTRASVTLDEKAAAKILKSGRDWMTYDDADTWKIKLDFARSQCLGGAMVWAISQDTLDGKYSKQLQSVTGYKSRAVTTITTNVNVGIPGSVLKEMEISESSTDVTKQQCRWSNCGQGCPSGWKAVLRRDPSKHSIRELMYDDTGCDGKATRVFCCPPGDQPWCQWLFFNGGKCNPGCPADSGIEVASTKAGCNNGKAQVACCKDGGSSMDIYRQCQWYGKEHDCAVDLGTKSCGWSSTYNMPLFSSGDGSGAQVCRDSSGRRASRPYCCDESDSSKPRWKNCQWYDNFALGLTPYAGEKTCNANCPAGKIKIALDQYESLCGDGTAAYCCDGEVTISADEKKKNLKEALEAWAKAPTCPNVKGSLSSRSLSETQGDETQGDETRLSRIAGSTYGTTLPVVFNTAFEALASCDMWKVGFVKGFPAWTKAGFTATPMKTLYNILGSVSNPSEMVNCESKLNNIKSSIWSLRDPMKVDKWNKRCKPTTKLAAETAITTLQMVFGVWQYQNDEGIRDRLVTTHMGVANFLGKFEELYRKEYPKTPPMGLEDGHWREYMVKHVERMVTASKAWAEGRVNSLISDWTAHENSLLQKTTGSMTAQAAAALANEINLARQNLIAFQLLKGSIDATFTFNTNIFLEY